MLAWLPYLLCPLMMLVCMGGLRRPGKRRAQRDAPSPIGRAEEIALLRRQQADLTRRLDMLVTEPEESEHGASHRRAAG